MAHRFSELTFTPAVEPAQRKFGSFETMQSLRQRLPDFDRLGERERHFIGQRDSFYLATISESGWPYIQHRGGEPGFLRILSETRLAFANYVGNRQYQSLGNISHQENVSLFLVDYPNKRRMKLLGKAKFYLLTDLPEQLQEVFGKDVAQEKVESIVQIDLEAFDWNCPQHLTPRFSEQEWLDKINLTEGNKQ